MMEGLNPDYVVRLFNAFDYMIRYKTPSGAKVFVGDEECSKTVRYYVSTKGKPMVKRANPKGEIGSYKRKNGISDEVYKRILGQIPQGTWDERIHTKNQTRYEIVETSIEAGRLVKVCNNVKDFNWDDVDFDFYAQEVKKLLF
jgi:hypothetical protein